MRKSGCARSSPAWPECTVSNPHMLARAAMAIISKSFACQFFLQVVSAPLTIVEFQDR